jgi:hypothetical protein
MPRTKRASQKRKQDNVAKAQNPKRRKRTDATKINHSAVLSDNV